MANYSFRFLFHISHRQMISGDDKVCNFTMPNGHSASMQCIDGEDFSRSLKFLIYSGGYSTEEEAWVYAKKMQDSVLCLGAISKLGVDVGKDTANCTLGDDIKERMFREHGLRVVEEIHGVSVYSEEHKTVFIASTGSRVVLPKEAESFTSDVCAILSTGHDWDKKLKLSMELLTSSFFESSARARFLTLVLSAEALIAPDARPSKVQELIDKLKNCTISSDITPCEKNSILGSLSWLYSDSISQSLKKMAAKHLPHKTYNGLSSEHFIKECYEARSQLVHTGSLEDSEFNIGTLAANLEVYMKDLLAEISGIDVNPLPNSNAT